MDGSKSILRARKERINSVVQEQTSTNLQSYGKLLPRVEEDQLEQQEEVEERYNWKLKKIIAADDQNINIEVLKTDFAEL
jgi:hypothetical protein